MRMARQVVLAAVALALGARAASACMSDASSNEVAEGRLTVATRQDAAGRTERPYILVLATPACLGARGADDSVDSTRTIHIYSANPNVSARIGRLIGRTVRVRGQPFAAHTSHHHAPIVMEISEIDAR